jgi:hypothetical protein
MNPQELKRDGLKKANSITVAQAMKVLQDKRNPGFVEIDQLDNQRLTIGQSTTEYSGSMAPHNVFVGKNLNDVIIIDEKHQCVSFTHERSGRRDTEERIYPRSPTASRLFVSFSRQDFSFEPYLRVLLKNEESKEYDNTAVISLVGCIRGNLPSDLSNTDLLIAHNSSAGVGGYINTGSTSSNVSDLTDSNEMFHRFSLRNYNLKTAVTTETDTETTVTLDSVAGIPVETFYKVRSDSSSPAVVVRFKTPFAIPKCHYNVAVVEGGFISRKKDNQPFTAKTRGVHVQIPMGITKNVQCNTTLVRKIKQSLSNDETSWLTRITTLNNYAHSVDIRLSIEMPIKAKVISFGLNGSSDVDHMELTMPIQAMNETAVAVDNETFAVTGKPTFSLQAPAGKSTHTFTFIVSLDETDKRTRYV